MHMPRLRHQAARREAENAGHDSAGMGQPSYDSYITTAPTDGQGCRNQIQMWYLWSIPIIVFLRSVHL
jgi:hypothetical protein